MTKFNIKTAQPGDRYEATVCKTKNPVTIVFKGVRSEFGTDYLDFATEEGKLYFGNVPSKMAPKALAHFKTLYLSGDGYSDTITMKVE